MLIHRITHLIFTELYGKQFKEVGCTRNSKKAGISMNRTIMYQTDFKKVRLRLSVHLVACGWVCSQTELRIQAATL